MNPALTKKSGFTLISLLLAKARRSCKGFTLIELLIVIAIIAILAVVVAVIINPLELLRRSRDSTRLRDLEAVNSAINKAAAGTSASTFPYCVGPFGMPPPVACNSSSYFPSSRLINGQGWIRIDFTTQSLVTIPALPLDPVNTSASGLYYKYCGVTSGYEINAVLESSSYKNIMVKDGGNDPNKYEIGTNLQISSCN